MNAKEFLRQENILAKDKNSWMIKFENGKEVDLVDLFERFLLLNHKKDKKEAIEEVLKLRDESDSYQRLYKISKELMEKLAKASSDIYVKLIKAQLWKDNEDRYLTEAEIEEFVKSIS